MAEYYTTWEDGRKKWERREETPKKKHVVESDFDNVLTVTLIACDVKTDVAGESWMVKHADEVLKHWMISDVTSWDRDQNVITIHSSFEYPIQLVFSSISQAIKANNRLFLIMNGENIVGCTDEDGFVCTLPTNLSLNFS
jgi:hypothetical protein